MDYYIKIKNFSNDDAGKWFDWCEQNCMGRFSFNIIGKKDSKDSYYLLPDPTIEFELEGDVVLFQMRWL